VERKKAQVVIIIGEDEINKGELTLKQTASQKSETIKRERLIEVLDSWFLEAED